MMKSSEQQRAASARRQREYRERQKGYKKNLEERSFKADVLEDAIKLAANKGDNLALSVQACVHNPTVENLAAYFRKQAEHPPAYRSASRNAKKPATA